MTTIRMPRKALTESINTRGWIKGWGDGGDGPTCLHGHIRSCTPIPGDAYLIEKVTAHRETGGIGWNDSQDDVATILDWVKTSAPIDDSELEDVFGPQWRQIVQLVRQAAVITPEQAQHLAAAWDTARAAAWAAARAAASDTARPAARAAARAAASDTAWGAASDTAWDAALAISIHDLISATGFTQAHYDKLVGPWTSVFGDPMVLDQ